MNLDYKTTTKAPDSLRTLHIVVVDGEILTTTRKSEILPFVKSRGPNAREWKQIREAVRLERALTLRD